MTRPLPMNTHGQESPPGVKDGSEGGWEGPGS